MISLILTFYSDPAQYSILCSPVYFILEHPLVNYLAGFHQRFPTFNLKVAAVFFGCNNDRFGGCGSVLKVQDLLHESCKTLFKGGFRQLEAVDILKEFYKGENPNAPVEKRKPARD